MNYFFNGLLASFLFLITTSAFGMAARLRIIAQRTQQAGAHTFKRVPQIPPRSLTSFTNGLPILDPEKKASPLYSFLPFAFIGTVAAQEALEKKSIDDSQTPPFSSDILRLSDSQIINSMEQWFKKDKTFENFDTYVSTSIKDKRFYEKALKKIEKVVLEKGSRELRNAFAFYVVPSQREKMDIHKWITLLESENYDPLKDYESHEGRYDDPRPVFSKDRSLTNKAIRQATASYIFPNFEGLLPDILAYVNHEYEQGRRVVFHGRSPDWMFLALLYDALDNEIHDKKSSDNFVPLRFQKHSTLTKEKEKEIRNPCRASDDILDHLLFVNNSLFKNERTTDLSNSRDSWLFAAKGMDESANRNYNEDPQWVKNRIKKIFIDNGMQKEYEQLKTKNPHIFKELKNLFDAAIQEQGNHGQLLVLSMPEEKARQSVYVTNPNGTEQNAWLPEDYALKHRAGPTAIKMGMDEYGIPLTEQFINREVAEKAGIRIVGFDPAVYQRTSNYLKFEQKLQQVIHEMKILHEQDSVQSAACQTSSPF